MTEHERLREQRLAANQSLYRVVNEQIEALNQAFEETAGVDAEWVCECADMDCAMVVSAQLHEYEAVRLNARTSWSSQATCSRRSSGSWARTGAT